MSRRRLLQIIVGSASLLMIIGVVLMGYIMATEEDRSVIKVDLDEGGGTSTEQSFDFECLALVPGESCEYTLILEGEESNQYEVTLKLYENEADKGHTLKNFAYVRIESGEEVVCDALLKDVFEGEGFVLPVDQEKRENTELRFIYYLPIDVGNEAQNAEAFFGLRITATNENE